MSNARSFVVHLPHNSVAQQAVTRAAEVERLQAELSRGDNLIWLTVEVIQAVRTAFSRWQKRRRTRREFSTLDTRQLRDIGLNGVYLDPVTRWFMREETCRALADLNDSEARDLSNFGRKQRRRLRHGGSDQQQW